MSNFKENNCKCGKAKSIWFKVCRKCLGDNSNIKNYRCVYKDCILDRKGSIFCYPHLAKWNLRKDGTNVCEVWLDNILN